MVHTHTEYLTIGQLVRGLPRMVLTPAHTVMQAVEMMDHFNRYAVGVESNGKFAGLFTYNDYLSDVLLKTRHPGHTLLEEVMELDPMLVDPACSVMEVQETCYLNNIRYFPVVESGKILTIMSVSDLAGGREQHYQHALPNIPAQHFTNTQQRVAVFPV